MSINHYSMELPETTLWWTQQQQQQQQQQGILMEATQSQSQNPAIHPSWPPQQQPPWLNSIPNSDPSFHYPTTTPRLNLNNQNEEDEEEDDEDDTTNTTPTRTHQQTEDEKEPMFEKPLTPSDVGKLNRLVIPKQHAEKYFPLGGPDSPECKGLLLSFEDESGKCWRFRYSYWNSSQSYVLTKGWSRYVKDKRLDAGDVVLFERHRADAHRLFISWRRRRHTDTAPAHVSRTLKTADANSNSSSSKNEVVVGGGVGVAWTRDFYSAHPYPTHHPFPYQHDCLHAGIEIRTCCNVTGRGSQGEKQRTKVVGKSKSSSSSSSSSSKVLRLFGVNMECQPEHDSGPSTPQSFYNIMPSTQSTHNNHHFYHQPSSNPHHPHMVRHQPYYY
ncbi:hypothetical protein VNO77_15900 [Canavalia gladiata]|uniref:TF-B3 domain-containing protein n=1 Tax=Canavalia gladiata TaxID=3824 RepID=A0AAN9M042_CANGL